MAKQFARRLRKRPTEEERIVWGELRKRRIDGLKFRRQHPLGPYIVDFVCLERRFVFEIDGVQHGETEGLRYDAARTAWLTTEGYTVYRAWNWEIRENLDGVMMSLFDELGLLTEVTPTPALPPQGGGGETD
jgi:very-short-patch-repair endonuclease